MIQIAMLVLGLMVLGLMVMLTHALKRDARRTAKLRGLRTQVRLLEQVNAEVLGQLPDEFKSDLRLPLELQQNMAARTMLGLEGEIDDGHERSQWRDE